MADTRDEVLQTLRRAVHNDPALQARLFALTDAGEFIAAVQQLAQSAGHTLTVEEVRHAMRNGRKLWSDRKQP